MLVINDVHLGVQRTGGTTPSSAEALRAYLLQGYEGLLDMAEEVLVNGDLFDNYLIPMSDLLQAYQITATWLRTKGKKLHLLPGNHCLSKSSANLSSFELMARLLQTQYPDKVTYLQGGGWVDQSKGWYAISHVPNQDLFDLELSKVPEDTKYLFIHVNFDNSYATQADHSLNISRDQAKVLVKRGVNIVIGHEHQGRTLMNDKVVIPGNPRPSSVSDCLKHGDGQADGRKYALAIDGDDMELIPTWGPTDPEGWYREIDWRDLGQAPDGRGFLRVTGDAESAEAADVIKAIAKLRQGSEAFVITNAVKVAGVDGVDALAESVEDIKSVDVVQMLLESLDPEQRAVLEKLMKEEA